MDTEVQVCDHMCTHLNSIKCKKMKPMYPQYTSSDMHFFLFFSLNFNLLILGMWWGASY
jgi:hypothetical protein